MSENIPPCQINKKYAWIECTYPAMPADNDGFCILHSQDKQKDKKAFNEALESKLVPLGANVMDFQGIFFPMPFNIFKGIREFHKMLDFSYATFMENEDFSRATFTEPVFFQGANFVGQVDFNGANFLEKVVFLGANFAAKAIFCGSKFLQNVDFSTTMFKGEADFYEATFSDGANFSFTTFNNVINFTAVNIAGRVVFMASNPSVENLSPALEGEFHDLALKNGSKLLFQDLSLAKVEFKGTDLRIIDFHHVTWHNYHRRQIIYDEVLLRKEEKEIRWFLSWLWRHGPFAEPPIAWVHSYKDVERLYCNLKINYESHGDFKNAGDFHYGEMEMHRRISKWRWFPFYWYNLYWALRGYGERPSRALAWLAVLLGFFTCLLALTGLEILDPKHIPSIYDYFFYLLEKVTLQRPTWAEPVGFWGKLVAGLSVLLIPGQAALLLLALRNRLGRRR